MTHILFCFLLLPIVAYARILLDVSRLSPAVNETILIGWSRDDSDPFQFSVRKQAGEDGEILPEDTVRVNVVVSGTNLALRGNISMSFRFPGPHRLQVVDNQETILHLSDEFQVRPGPQSTTYTQLTTELPTIPSQPSSSLESVSSTLAAANANDGSPKESESQGLGADSNATIPGSAIIGAIVGLFILFFIALLAAYLLKRRRNGKPRQSFVFNRDMMVRPSMSSTAAEDKLTMSRGSSLEYQYGPELYSSTDLNAARRWGGN